MNMTEESLCKTCTNIFNFPECCEENLEDCIKIISSCRNYHKCGIIRDCLSCLNSHSKLQERGENNYEV